ncbi:MAG TPA: class I SAM-dependent methyltransferase [Cyclobacteriaceae bacterium]
MSNGYNRIAGIYDGLARIVFGKSMIQSQTIFLDQLQNCKSILVLGGGTGWWLSDLLKKSPHLNITFVDSSSEMIRRAKMKLELSHHVDFIHGTVEDLQEERKFDGVVLFYFLDLFSEKDLEMVLQRIKVKIIPNSIWLVSDFVNKKKWHAVFLKLMYTFFRLTTGSNSKQLPDWQGQLDKAGLVKVKDDNFYKGFILATLYSPDKS